MGFITGKNSIFGRNAAKANESSLPAEAMLEEIPLAVLVCDLNFEIVYANKASREALKKIQHVLPVRAESIVGQTIDVFHKNPSHQRRLLADPRNLPHKARITIGGEWLDLFVTAPTRTATMSARC